jgi:tetratricopeptide (TPR) repeat protein
VIELHPQSHEALHARGEALLKQRRYLDAINDFTAALKVDPEKLAAMAARGCAKVCLKQYQDSFDDFRGVL